MTRTRAAPVPTTVTAAMAAGKPMPRPLGGSTGPEAIAGPSLGVADGVSWIGPGGETGGSMTPPGASDGDCSCLRCLGVGATCGPVPDTDDCVGVGASDGVAVRVRVGFGDADRDGALPTVTEPCAVAGPLVAVTDSRPDVVPVKLRDPDVDEFGATCCE
jgi:hypothetical protein